MTTKHGLVFSDNKLTVNGVVQVVEITEKECVFKLEGQTLAVKGSNLNMVALDKEKCVVALEVGKLYSLTYRENGVNLKGLFR